MRGDNHPRRFKLSVTEINTTIRAEDSEPHVTIEIVGNLSAMAKRQIRHALEIGNVEVSEKKNYLA
jgi:hypothetical protein